MTNIPETIYAEMADMVLMCWDDMRMGEMMIQMEMNFPGSLDVPRLARALDLVLDMQPVLGCRAEMRPKRMLWRRLPPDQRKNLIVTSDERAFDGFRLLRIDATTGPLVQACLLQSGGGDRLILKVAHQAADAGGVKETAEDIAAIYTRLENEPDYLPEPNLTGCRDWIQIYRLVPKRVYPKIFINFLRECWLTMVPYASRMIALPAGGPLKPISFVARHIPEERVAALSAYGKSRGASINDIIATAFIRANAATGNPSGRGHLRLHMTIDLRRWHLNSGRAEGICNLSAFEFVSLGRNPGRNFEEALSRVSSHMRRRKANLPGLSQAPYLPLYYNLSYNGLKKFFGIVMKFMIKKKNFPNMLTNMGPIVPEKVSFSGMAPSRAWMLVPPIFPPVFGAGLSGYKGSLTITAGAPEPAKAAVEAYFDKIIAELPV